MEALKEFTVPLTGLKPGAHVYKMEAGKDFFSHFENSPIQEGLFQVEISLDRRTDMAIVDFDIQGSYRCNCDRCLVAISLPIEIQDEIILKFDEQGDDSDEVIYLDSQASEWNAAKVVYELICLAKPLINVYDCKGKPCDQTMLKKLNEYETHHDDDNDLWKDLQNIQLN